MMIKLIGNEKEVHLDNYDKLARYKPEACLYMYGRKTFGYVLGGYKYEVDGDSVRMIEYIDAQGE